ncbi:MAG: hypothetical protein R3E48_18505 [Burkholderiaceae bacterium]
MLSFLLIAFAALSWWRAAVWADPASLWREATLSAPDSARAWHNRAVAEIEAGDPRAARVSIERALKANPADILALEISDALATRFAQAPGSSAQPTGERR